MEFPSSRGAVTQAGIRSLRKLGCWPRLKGCDILVVRDGAPGSAIALPAERLLAMRPRSREHAMDDLKSIIGKVATGATLSRDEAASAFDSMMSGEATPSQMGGLLMALRVRGETVDEITGAVTAMRAKMLRVKAPVGAVDVVGTGGDGSGSVNVSTCASFIVAGCGVPVAKHGNRALSSRSGAADVLSSLGV